MKESTRNILTDLVVRYPALGGVEKDILQAFFTLQNCYEKGGRVYLCGNGGSTADCEHIVGELMKCFKKHRPIDGDFAAALKTQGELGEELAHDLEGGLPAISLCGHSPLTFAYLNDKNPMLTFAQQLNVMGNEGDVLITLSTSGNSKNVVEAARTASALGISTVALTGEAESKLSEICDATINAPELDTFKVQECHLPIYHAICAEAERILFNK